MEEVTINQILIERGISYTCTQILDAHAKQLKSEINRRCRDFHSVDELINFSNSDQNGNNLNSLLSSFDWKNSYLPHIYCTTLGLKNGFIDPKLQGELYQSILKCINQGSVSGNIGIVKISDHSHPVRLATPNDKTCYSLVWREKDLSEVHDIPVVLGEYTGDVKYVGEEEISDESYSFQLTFKSSAFKFTGAVMTGNYQLLDDFSTSITNKLNDQPTYSPDGFEYIEANENSYSPNKSSFFSKPFTQGRNELLCTDGKIKKIGARLLLPNENEYILSADKACNEMAFLNHYECVFNNNFNFRINVQWHSVYVDGWPHIILTSIPGVGIKLGDELAADFGENWFSRIRRISESNIKNELILLRLKFNSSSNQGNMDFSDLDKNLSFDRAELKNSLSNCEINGLINLYEICEVCQSSISLPTVKSHYRPIGESADSFLKSKLDYLLCNGCNRAYHWYCVNRPELKDLKTSSKNWFCFQCLSLTLRILPSLAYRIPNLTPDLIDSIQNIYNSTEDLIPGVVDAMGSVILRSTDEVNTENPKNILFRPPEHSNYNLRYFNEYGGLEGLTKLKPCYLCYSSSIVSNQTVGIATICRIHRLHIAPDYDEFFNSVQYTYNSDSSQLIDNSCLYLSLIADDHGKRKYFASSQSHTENIIKPHLKKLSSSRYIIERSRRVICSLRQSLYQSEKHRVELLYKLEKLRKIQDEYFRTISEGNGMIPVLCIKIGSTILNKEFSGRLYQGVVSRYYPKERIFHVEYFDGDREDLEYNDFISLLTNDVKNNRTNIEDLLITDSPVESTKQESEKLEPYIDSQRSAAFVVSEDFYKYEKFEFNTNKIKNDSLLTVTCENLNNDSIFEKVMLIHKLIIQECKINKASENAILIRKTPKYEYIDQPEWNNICGSLNIESNLIKYFISVNISRTSHKTTTFNITSKINMGNIVLIKTIPITMNNDFGVYNDELTQPNEKSRSEILFTIRFSAIEILTWTQNRLSEIYIKETSLQSSSDDIAIKEIDRYDYINNEQNSHRDLGDSLSSNFNATLVKENWLQKANLIAQALQPYPNGIKWINDTHSWKVVYLNELGQKISKFFNTIPFDENATVESLYLKACKFVSVSQTNNKVIKMFSTSRKLKKITNEISNPLDKFIFNEWGNTIEDFLARYNLNNPDRTVYSINDFNNEINSLRPFPDNLDWCDSTFSFVVTLPDNEKRSFQLDRFEFNIINCYSSAYNLAIGNVNVDKEFYNRKIRKYNSRVKNNINPIQLKKQISKKYLVNKHENFSEEKKENFSVNKSVDTKQKNSNEIKAIKNGPSSQACLYQDKEAMDISISSEENLINSCESKTDPKKLISEHSKENSFGELLNSDESQHSIRAKNNKKCKAIVRALPAPSDPLSRARIIEYSKKADELRPFPHGITWCYRSARFKVRYRRSSDGCWTATSFTPTKFNSVKEAFESAVDKLAAHINDYKNSNEIPIIPKKRPLEIKP
ncbi:protein with N-terminal apicomplexan-specific globular domain plus PHD domain [Cryptosporidium sp. chipmunk genotype I]|uniref:protein with N-terminal apicomplexan-specific globular domain plus PHD domain n=1 Tax=Cryptosporidium sp. chipmunk genotype I TaxID=1280935 RepID=UPI00351A1E84|nr:protein with N-terminal apicomplexan-specific globular domain plus PHD domain [Cryptosporidium sp. chipmunk genotype I]